MLTGVNHTRDKTGYEIFRHVTYCTSQRDPGVQQRHVTKQIVNP